MKYSKMLKELFAGISLTVEDLLLLESFQIKYIPDRVPHKEYATLIRNYPFVKTFLELKYPSIKDFNNELINAHEENNDSILIKEYCDELIWEIADLIVYNKHPEIYDDKADFNWSIEEIIAKEILAGKVVTDVGAGSGMLAFMLANFADTVYAVEPISNFRSYIKQRAVRESYSNIFVVDGFLDSLPFPNNTFDILFTSNSIGWNIEEELQEIERVVKPNGLAIHIMRSTENWSKSPVHKNLISLEWNYKLNKIQDEKGLRLKYTKTITEQ